MKERFFRTSLLLAFCLAGLAFSASSAIAGGGDYTLPSGGGGGDPANPGGSAIGGPVTWYELQNTSSNLPRIPPLFAWDPDKGRVADAANHLTRRLLRPCRYRNAPGCVLWKAEAKSSDFNSPRTQWEVHAGTLSGQPAVTSGRGVIWNVRIWRENPDKGRFDLLFERRVGARAGFTDGSPAQFRGETTDVRDALPAWFQGGSLNPVFRFGSGQVARGKAGPIFNGAQPACRARLGQKNRNGRPGRFDLRLKPDSSGLIKKRMVRAFDRPFLPPRNPSPRGWASCYWEGPDIGPRWFRWGKPSGTQKLVEEFKRNQYFFIKDGKKVSLRSFPGQFGNEVSQVEGKFNSNNANAKLWSGNLGGVVGLGSREAIWIKWKLPLEGTAQQRISVNVEGAPGLLYAIQIVRLDRVEDILPVKGQAGKNLWWVGWGNPDVRRRDVQNFRVFNFSPIPPAPCLVNCEDPRTYEEGGEAPTADLRFDAPARTSVLTPTRAGLVLDGSFGGDKGDPARQALFINSGSITHFTPQMDVSCLESNYIDAGYTSYRQPVDTESMGFNFTAPGANGSCGGSAKAMKSSGFFTVDPTRETASWSEEMPLNITWSRPTLEKPCRMEGDPLQTAFNGDIPRAWPPTPRNPFATGDTDTGSCPDTFNAWDDLLVGEASWQAIWSEGLADVRKEEDLPGRIVDQPLRCEPSGSGIMFEHQGERCDDWNPLARVEGQKAQGYLLLPDVIGQNIPLRIKLGTFGMTADEMVSDNPKIYLRGMDPVDRDTATRWGVSWTEESNGSETRVDNLLAGPKVNTVTGESEINFCDTGIPSKARVMGLNSGYSLAEIKASPLCAGYALVWRWKDNAASCEVRATPRPLGFFPLPGSLNYIQQPANQPYAPLSRVKQLASKAGLAGGYSWRGGGPAAVYKHQDPNGNLLWQAGTSPFYGNRPGPDNFRTCEKNGKKGYLSRGWWEPARTDGTAFGGLPDTVNAAVQPGWGKNNSGGAFPSSEIGDQLIVEFPLNEARGNAPAWKWNLRADYTGFYNRIWRYKNQSEKIRTFIEVLSPRSTR